MSLQNSVAIWESRRAATAYPVLVVTACTSPREASIWSGRILPNLQLAETDARTSSKRSSFC